MHRFSQPAVWMRRLSAGLAGVGVLAAVGATGVAHAEYPERPVTMVVPFGPGGGTDVLGRLVSEPFARELGEAVIVENRAGAAGAIGTASVAKSDPDGYRVLFTAMAPITVASNMPDANLSYDPQKDLTPVAMVARQPVLFVANGDLEADSFEELMALAEQEPGGLAIGSAGTGTDMHLIGELLQQVTGAEFLHVPYKGGGPAINDLVAGHIDLMVVVTSSILPHIQSGAVKPLLTFESERLDLLPEVPTVGELGYPEVEGDSRWALFAPAGTPDNVVATLGNALQRVDADPKFRERLTDLGVVPAFGDGQVLGEYVSEQLGKWQAVVADADLGEQ